MTVIRKLIEPYTVDFPARWHPTYKVAIFCVLINGPDGDSQPGWVPDIDIIPRDFAWSSSERIPRAACTPPRRLLWMKPNGSYARSQKQT